MSEFEESRTLTCPCCKKRFAECEGPLCSCEEDAWDMLEEMKREEDEAEAFDNGPFGVGA